MLTQHKAKKFEFGSPLCSVCRTFSSFSANQTFLLSSCMHRIKSKPSRSILQLSPTRSITRTSIRSLTGLASCSCSLHTREMHVQASRTVRHEFFTRQGEGDHPRRPDANDVGRTIQVLTTRLPFLLKEGALPPDILSDTITLELLPSTLGLPEIKGKTTYTAISKMGAWSVTTLRPRAEFIIDSQKLIGSARRCERMLVRFRLVDGEDGAVLYTGLFHFYFDSRGKISRHVFEIVDNRFSPGHLMNWLMGKKVTEKNLGYCYQRCEQDK